MAKTPVNDRKRWSEEEVKYLRQLAEENTPTRVMALKLERSESSVRRKASTEKISLKPTNQRPRGTRER